MSRKEWRVPPPAEAGDFPRRRFMRDLVEYIFQRTSIALAVPVLRHVWAWTAKLYCRIAHRQARLEFRRGRAWGEFRVIFSQVEALPHQRRARGDRHLGTQSGDAD